MIIIVLVCFIIVNCLETNEIGQHINDAIKIIYTVNDVWDHIEKFVFFVHLLFPVD